MPRGRLSVPVLSTPTIIFGKLRSRRWDQTQHLPNTFSAIARWVSFLVTVLFLSSSLAYHTCRLQFGPASGAFGSDDIYLGQLIGCLELLHAGTTTVLDHAHGDFSNATLDAALNATIDSHIRAFFAPAIHDLSLVNNYSIPDQRQKVLSLVNDSRLLNNDVVSLGLAYDRFISAPQEEVMSFWDIVRFVLRFSQQQSTSLTFDFSLHNLSVVTAHYVAGPYGQTGKLISLLSMLIECVLTPVANQADNSPRLLHQYGVLNTSTPVILSHASFLNEVDMELLRQTRQYISSTPESELHYGHGHPNIWHIQDQASIGVDTHFTYSADMVSQARLWLQTLRGVNFKSTLEDNSIIPYTSPMSVEQAFKQITRNGALALRRPDLGIIAPGAMADLVIFDGSSPNMAGWDDPVAAVILHSNVGDVTDVLVNGEFVKRDGQLTHPNYTTVRQEFERSARRIQRIWKKTDFGSLAGNPLGFGIVPYGEATQIDVEIGPGTGY